MTTQTVTHQINDLPNHEGVFIEATFSVCGDDVTLEDYIAGDKDGNHVKGLTGAIKAWLDEPYNHELIVDKAAREFQPEPRSIPLWRHR